MSLDKFDTSHWLLDDKDWIGQRKKDWLRIEISLKEAGHKSKKAITIIKRYFLKGDLPDFKALQEWQGDARHLDLFCFLWLHPLWDKELLIELRDDFASDSNVSKEDIWEGIGTFNGNATLSASSAYALSEGGNVFCTSGHNLLIFDLLIMDKLFNNFLNSGRKTWSIPYKEWDFGLINDITRWLKYEMLNSVNQDCLYQYESYLEYWAEKSKENVQYFEKKMWQRKKGVVSNALVRIVDFDTDKEGDSPRTRSVLKLREIMESYDFHPEVTDMWAKAKAGALETKGDPWK